MPPEDSTPGRELAWPDDELVVRYLLGALPDDDTECLDELSITDDEFVLRLRTVEQDLIDAYVKGELSAGVRALFRSRYLVWPAQRKKVRFAEALFARAIPFRSR
jgi:hypothetical protein